MNILKVTPEDDLQKIISGIKQPTTLLLSNGIYNQKLDICADYLTIIGENPQKTKISFNDYARKIHADGKEYNTFRTYTVCVTGEGVKLKNFTIENSNTSPETVGQCVALSVHAKNFYAENMILHSTQDTLFLSPFPDDLVVRYRGFIPHKQLYAEGGNLHLFDACEIRGTVDFIFGCSQAYFLNCKIVSLNEKRGTGYIAAPAHPLAEEYGFNFIGCEIVSDGAGRNSVYLARPWRDFGKCTFINCRAGEHINSELFDKWNDTERDKSARFGYYNLSCGQKPTPASWAKQLTKSEAQIIISRCEEKFKEVISR